MRKLPLWTQIIELTALFFDRPGGYVWGSGQQSEAMERKPHHLQTGAPLHTGMGSLQCHSNGNTLPTFCLIYFLVLLYICVCVFFFLNKIKFNMLYRALNARCRSGSATAKRITASLWWPHSLPVTGWSQWCPHLSWMDSWRTWMPTWSYSQTTGRREHQTSHTWVRWW